MHEAADGLAAGAEGRERRKVGRVVHAGPADGDVVGEDLAEGDERGVAHAVAFAVLVAQRVLQELELVVLERDVGGFLHAVADLQQRAVGAEAGERPDVGVAEMRDAVEALLCAAVGAVGAVEAGVGVAVVGGDDHERVVAPGGKLDGDAHGVVERELVVDQVADVVGVCGVVDASAFDLEDEAVGARAQAVEGNLRHLGERGHAGGDGGIGFAVEGKGQVLGVEGAEQSAGGAGGAQACGVVDHLVAGAGEVAGHVAVVGALGGVEKLGAAAEEHVDADVEVLAGDLALLGAFGDLHGEAGGRGVRDRGGGDEPGAQAGGVGEAHDGRIFLAVGADVEGAVVDLVAAAPGGGAGGGVGDGRVGRGGVDEGEVGVGLGVEADPVCAAALVAHAETLGHRERAEAHAVAHEEDDVARAAGGGGGRRRSRLRGQRGDEEECAAGEAGVQEAATG